MPKNNLYKQQCIIFNSLFEQNNIQEVVNISETILKNPIFILDTSYEIIAKSPLAKEVNSYIETSTGKCYLMNNFVNLMKKNKCIDSIYNVNKSFFFTDENNNDEFIFCPIKTNNLTTFYIGILKKYVDFTDEHLELTNTLAKVLSIQVEKDNLFFSNSGLDSEYYLTDLLSNKINNIDDLKRRLTNIEFTLNKYFIVISIPFYRTCKDYKHNFALKEIFKNIKNIFKNSIFTYHQEKVIFLITSNVSSVVSKNELDRLIDFIKLNKLKCGVSMAFTNIFDTKHYFEQADFVSSLCKESDILFFSNYMHTYLFSNCSEKVNLSTLIHPSIKSLMDYDDKHNTELLKTLKVYLNNNRNVISASSLLNIHKSTFFYRYHKIEDIINYSLDSDNLLFKLELSFKILDYIKANVT